MKNSIEEENKFTIDMIPEPEDIENVIFTLMVNPNLSSINYFNDFSDLDILPDSIGESDNDETGLFDLDAPGSSMVMSTHAFHHHLENDPKRAAEILVSRAVRKMLCFGARPVAVSAFLYHIDFADPNGHSIASGAKKGLENVAEKFHLKILDRKIRFDHFSGHGPVPPTLIISMAGVVDEKNRLTTHAFKKKGGNIFMLGCSVDDIGSSEYLEFYHGVSESALPAFNLEQEIVLQKALLDLHQKELIQSASPVGKGGLFFTLLRAAIPNGLGFDITSDAEIRLDSFLFGEAMGRILLEVDPEKQDEFVDYLSGRKIPFFALGHITRGELRIDDHSFGYIDKMTSGV
ncbi:MAG: AIR synthase-related protein [Mariniphaga sp.]|nr:AIR synthase-related protein [Mariniphaga sp.]